MRILLLCVQSLRNIWRMIYSDMIIYIRTSLATLYRLLRILYNAYIRRTLCVWGLSRVSYPLPDNVHMTANSD